MSAMPSTVVQPALRRVVRQDRRGLAVVGLQTRNHGLALVVGAADELVAPHTSQTPATAVGLKLSW